MEAMCGSMMAALDVAKALMLVRDDLRTVLLVSGYRNNDLVDLSESATRFMMDIGSGGSALVLRKNAGRNAVLASAFRGDGSLSEMCVVPALGSKAWPPSVGDLARSHFMVPDERAFKDKLNEITLPNFYEVVREAASKSGFARGGGEGHRLPRRPPLQAEFPREDSRGAGPGRGADDLSGGLRPSRPERSGALPRARPRGRQDRGGIARRLRRRRSRLRMGGHGDTLGRACRIREVSPCA